MSSQPGHGVLAAVEGLVAQLRATGMPASTSDSIDATSALRHVELTDRAAVKHALAATLVKDAQHLGTFDMLFELFFAGSTLPSTLGSLDDDALEELLHQAIAGQDELSLTRLVAELVNRHARFLPGQPVAGTFHVFRTFRAAHPDVLRARLAEPPEGEGPTADLRARLLADEAERKVERLRQAIEAEVRRRLVADRGAAAVARTLRQSLPEDVDFLTASSREVAELSSILAPLPAQLAASLARKRRHGRQGRIDFRATARKSMSTGGVPVEPAFHKPQPPKPELFVLADISGSVATFARFTLQLATAMRTQFRAVRCFVFVDGIDEVTHLLAEAKNVVELAERIDEARSGVHLDGRSDYGNAFTMFQRRWGGQVNSRGIVLVLGDARSNYRHPAADKLAAVASRASHLYWLNPEARAAWGDGDSVMHEYLPHCDGVYECRTVRQLKEFVAQLA
ncbi:VWA domain-containing protein [Amycolatopsis sp. GM8]|uniref:vWA domain-containing protein n=1 Tax=Amycolatopsis sp. GM8 TaxID=2896530 RepID=UPI001F37F5DF|nr:VWA domain-containing protein [Amycolatopsis sp. GM8]